MKYRNSRMILATILFLVLGTTATAAPVDETADKLKEAEHQARLEAEYQHALTMSEKDRHAAEASIEKAREHLHSASLQREKAAAESVPAQNARQAEMSKMLEELDQARRQLRETSREIARVNREVARVRADSDASRFVFNTSNRPVIGVVLGDASDIGIKVLGVSPDGPSERAGIKQGDVIVALGGRVLAAVDGTDNARDALNVALKEIKADEAVIVSVERGDRTLELTVIPEIREPLTWHSITRFPSVSAAPGSPEKIVMIERIEVPEIDTGALKEHIEQIRIEIDDRRSLMESGNVAPHDYDFNFELNELSEMGDFALHDANVWFGMPLTRGLKLAEIDSGLGEYFKTDRGVLVLSARADNALQLKSGDVILQVGKAAVNSPAEFMRALRDYQSGDEVEMDIKRKRKDQTLKTVMPENRSSYFAPGNNNRHTIKIITQSD